jgi:glycosyltransferase involved in cell wall biosynthesis
MERLSSAIGIPPLGCSDVSSLVGRNSVMSKKLLFVVNADWFFISHRLPIALEARQAGFVVHIATVITDKSLSLESYGLKVHPLGLERGSFGLINAVKTVFELRRIFISVKPDVVHLVTIKPVLLGGLVARWLKVPALVSAVSGLGYVFTAKGPVARVRRWAVIRFYSLALGHYNQTVIFQNPNDRDTLATTISLSTTKVEMIRGSGVDLKKYVFTPEFKGVPVVLLPARLLADKGVFEFVQAAKLLRAKRVSARFVLAGMVDSANPTSVSQGQLDDWVAEGVVEHWGYRTDMPQVISSANLVVLPSYREGLPKVLLEAAAGGRAVVTTNVPGCRDAIEPGLTGLLVSVRDPEHLAAAIEQLLANPEDRKAMGVAGRCLAVNEFDIRAVVDKHLAIYRRLLA